MRSLWAGRVGGASGTRWTSRFGGLLPRLQGTLLCAHGRFAADPPPRQVHRVLVTALPSGPLCDGFERPI